ncbi:hypothetical protein GGR20_003212 [Devosia subaequoris]|uniref:Uncharacterized protein n=1 Tax=Devosia subaequoris TaxID=395930 RepID=A0A7W6IPV5_9HYPH|nr:hypothetical protein [Devosia subaequoris]
MPQWVKLSPEDRMKVLPSITGYRAYLAKNSDLETIHFAGI